MNIIPTKFVKIKFLGCRHHEINLEILILLIVKIDLSPLTFDIELASIYLNIIF